MGPLCSPAEDYPAEHHGLADPEDVGPAAEAAGTPGALPVPVSSFARREAGVAACVLISWYCHNKISPLGQLETTEIYSLAVRGQKSEIRVSASWAPTEGSGGECFPAHPPAAGVDRILGTLGEWRPPSGLPLVCSSRLPVPVCVPIALI